MRPVMKIREEATWQSSGADVMSKGATTTGRATMSVTEKALAFD